MRQPLEALKPEGGGGWRWLKSSEIARFASPVALLVAWQIANSLGWISPRVMASPAQIAASAWRLTASGELPLGLVVSFARVAAGFALGLAVGGGLGALAGLSRLGEIVVDPLLQMLKALPFFGLLPLFILWFGIGELPKVLLVAIGVMVPVYLTLFGGIRNIDPRLIDVGRAFGMNATQITLKVALPAALPSLLVGVRYGFSIAWLSLVIGEQINAHAGIGAIIAYARDFLQTDVIIVCLLVYALMGLVTDALVRAIEARVLVWRPDVSS